MEFGILMEKSKVSFIKKKKFTEVYNHRKSVHGISNSNNNLNDSSSHVCKNCFRTFKDVNNYKEHQFQEHQITGKILFAQVNINFMQV